MPITNQTLSLLSELLSLASALFAFVYGLRSFFKRGIPLCLQSITMAAGCHALASLYHVCYMLTGGAPALSFTPAYLGHIGFFLFFITASYGQMDKIIDDGTAVFRPCRRIALVAPLAAAVLLIPNLRCPDLPLSLKVSYTLIWIFASLSVYFNMKHAIIPDLGFGFVKALKPYNALAIGVCFAELLCLTARSYLCGLLLLIFSIVFAALTIGMMLAAKKGVKEWTI